MDKFKHYEDNDILFDPIIRRMLMDHKEKIKNDPRTIVKEVDAAIAYRFEYHFSRLLTHLGIPLELHWLTMLINDRINTYQSCRSIRELYIPNIDVINEMIRFEFLCKEKF